MGGGQGRGARSSSNLDLAISPTLPPSATTWSVGWLVRLRFDVAAAIDAEALSSSAFCYSLPNIQLPRLPIAMASRDDDQHQRPSLDGDHESTPLLGRDGDDDAARSQPWYKRASASLVSALGPLAEPEKLNITEKLLLAAAVILLLVSSRYAARGWAGSSLMDSSLTARSSQPPSLASLPAPRAASTTAVPALLVMVEEEVVAAVATAATLKSAKPRTASSRRPRSCRASTTESRLATTSTASQSEAGSTLPTIRSQQTRARTV